MAIWQTLNAGSWFDQPDEQLSDPAGNWSTPPYTIVTPETPLAPFHHNTGGSTYTSNMVRDWLRFGYTYPELQRWLPKYHNNAEYIADIKRQVRVLYADQISTKSLAEAPGSPSVTIDDYIVNVRYER